MRDYQVFSYTIAHYGRDYIGYSLKSIQPLVDRLYVFYTPHPSHGHRVDIIPVETEVEIIQEVFSYVFVDKIRWYQTDIWQEGQQRDYAVKTVSSEGAALILIVDYDEVWPLETLYNVLEYVWQANSARNWLLNFSHHFWRSFNWACTDDGWPVRIIDTRHSDGVAYIPKELGNVYHFGYCVTDATMRYKWQIHGHKDELRPNWFADKWSAWPPVEDCHPTNGRKENGEGWWNPQPFDKWQLPEIMRAHKWFDTERID